MRKVESTILISSAPSMVISAFTEQTKLSKWWSVERSLIEKKEGGIYVLAWNITQHGFGYVSCGIVKKYHPEKELLIENLVYLNPERPILGPMRLTVLTRDLNGKTELYLCQDGYQTGNDWDWYYDAVQGAWPVVLENLRKFLEV